MKRTLIIGQIVILLIIGVKVATIGQLFEHAGFTNKMDLVRAAVASTNPQAVISTTLGDAGENNLQKERDLYALLEKRKKELDSRQESLRLEEQKLSVLKKEIQDKIDQLGIIEKRLEVKLDAEKSADAKRFKDLAKIYESAAPAKAGAMLEKLDKKSAAGITMKM